MRRFRAHAFATALLAGALLTSPLASASESETDATAAQHQRFVLIQGDAEESGGPIAATGPIHARGTDVVLGNRKDRFEFPDGNLIIKHKPKSGLTTESFDPVTCLFTFKEQGTWRAIKGTGAYTQVQGHGTYRVLGQGVGCDQDRPPEVFILRIVARGPLSY